MLNIFNNKNNENVANVNSDINNEKPNTNDKDKDKLIQLQLGDIWFVQVSNS